MHNTIKEFGFHKLSFQASGQSIYKNTEELGIHDVQHIKLI